jgi:hypothetical protein
MNHTRATRRLAAVGAGCLAAGVLLAPSASAAPVLYGATGANDLAAPPSNLYRINPDTGAATSIGPIGRAITGLAVDPTNLRLYAISGGIELAGTPRQLMTLDPATGAGTPVGAATANEIEDLAFDQFGQLYGWNTTGDDLVRIDKATGAVTKVGEANIDGPTFGGGLAFDRNGVLYSFLTGDAGLLHYANASTGAVWGGSRLSASPNQTGASITSADFGCDGRSLWAVVNDFGDPPTYLVTIEPRSGHIAPAGQTGETQPNLDSIAWMCTPEKDIIPPFVQLRSRGRQSLSTLRGSGLSFQMSVNNEAAKVSASLYVRFRKGSGRGSLRRIASVSNINTTAHQVVTLKLRPSAANRRKLRSESRVPGVLKITATDTAGNVTRRTKLLTFR